MRPWALAAALGAMGCATVGSRLGAPVDDYASYRRVRLARTLEARMSAADAYLRAHPRGAWNGEVAAWLAQTEAAYVEGARRSAPRLRRYLATLPEGAYAGTARETLASLEAIADARREDDESLAAYADDVERELAVAHDQRRALVRDFARWARHLSTIRTWGEPTSALPHEMIHAWRIAPPAGRCVGDRCVKGVAHEYAIPEERRPAPRLALYDVVLLLSRGGVMHAQIAGPELFSRLGEAAMTVPVAPGDSQRRAESLATAVQLTEHAIEPAMPAARCAREAVSPTLLVRECDGARLELTAGTDGTEEDRLDAYPVVVAPARDARAGDPVPRDPEAPPDPG